MKTSPRIATVLAAFTLTAAASAAPMIPQVMNAAGNYVPAYQVQEQLQLASGNVASPAQVAFGGTYIFAQMASGYGSVAFQVLGPDGTTYETIISKTATDSTGGTAVQLQGGATVRAVLAGTTAASATLSRVP